MPSGTEGRTEESRWRAEGQGHGHARAVGRALRSVPTRAFCYSAIPASPCWQRCPRRTRPPFTRWLWLLAELSRARFGAGVLLQQGLGPGGLGGAFCPTVLSSCDSAPPLGLSTGASECALHLGPAPCAMDLCCTPWGSTPCYEAAPHTMEQHLMPWTNTLHHGAFPCAMDQHPMSQTSTLCHGAAPHAMKQHPIP